MSHRYGSIVPSSPALSQTTARRLPGDAPAPRPSDDPAIRAALDAFAAAYAEEYIACESCDVSFEDWADASARRDAAEAAVSHLLNGWMDREGVRRG